MRALRGADDDRQVPAARLHAPHAGKHEALYLVSIFDQEFYIQDPVSLLLDIKQVQLQRVEFHNEEQFLVRGTLTKFCRYWRHP